VLTPPPGILPPGSKATVEVDGLRLRKQPSTTAPVLATLAMGDTVTVWHRITSPQPVTAAGRTWYEVEDVAKTAGWVAAGEGGATFLTLAEPATCGDLQPASVTLEQLIDAGSWHRVACLGNTPVTITGVYVTSCEGGATRPGTFEPAWLIDWCPTELLTPKEGAKNFPSNALDTVSAPDLATRTTSPGMIARVTGHFDDPASSTCAIDPSYFEPLGWTVPSSSTVLDCREQFVVTRIEVLGSITLPPQG
jgi:hypothetical protein